MAAGGGDVQEKRAARRERLTGRLRPFRLTNQIPRPISGRFALGRVGGLLLRFQQELAFDAIGRRLGLSANAVRKRALRRLRHETDGPP
jgi:hypothetical protein